MHVAGAVRGYAETMCDLGVQLLAARLLAHDHMLRQPCV
jgi:hypothetical protein